jgi:hypothetical protein
MRVGRFAACEHEHRRRIRPAACTSPMMCSKMRIDTDGQQGRAVGSVYRPLARAALRQELREMVHGKDGLAYAASAGPPLAAGPHAAYTGCHSRRMRWATTTTRRPALGARGHALDTRRRERGAHRVSEGATVEALKAFRQAHAAKRSRTS